MPTANPFNDLVNKYEKSAEKLIALLNTILLKVISLMVCCGSAADDQKYQFS